MYVYLAIHFDNVAHYYKSYKPKRYHLFNETALDGRPAIKLSFKDFLLVDELDALKTTRVFVIKLDYLSFLI